MTISNDMVENLYNIIAAMSRIRLILIYNGKSVESDFDFETFASVTTVAWIWS